MHAKTSIDDVDAPASVVTASSPDEMTATLVSNKRLAGTRSDIPARRRVPCLHRPQRGSAMLRLIWMLIAAIGPLLMVGHPLPAEAAITTFWGIDYGAYPSNPHPQSNAAAAAFDSAAGVVGAVHLIDFETAPLGPFKILNVAPGVQILASPDGGAQSILNAPIDSQSAKTGYNITVGGKQFNQMHGGSETFNFQTPIYGFGAYLVGIANNAYFTFYDGSSQTISFASLFDVGIFGGVTFVGFVDPAKPISSVTISIARSLGVPDNVGVDDVRYVSSVPEPAAGVLFCSGLLFAFLARLRGALRWPKKSNAGRLPAIP